MAIIISIILIILGRSYQYITDEKLLVLGRPKSWFSDITVLLSVILNYILKSENNCFRKGTEFHLSDTDIKVLKRKILV